MTWKGTSYRKKRQMKTLPDFTDLHISLFPKISNYVNLLFRDYGKMNMRENKTLQHIDFDAFEKGLQAGSWHPKFKSRYLVLRMRYEQKLTYKQIGEIYGISTSRVGQIINKQIRIALRYHWASEE